MKYHTGKSNILFIVVAALALGIGLYTQVYDGANKNAPEFSTTILLPKARAVGEVKFTDHLKQPFGIEQLKGKWSVLFFGFTNCPDICPTTMQTLKQVKQTVSDASLWHHFQVVMVSVDPERDSLDRLANYVPFFDPEFIGIAGSVQHTTEFAKNLGILFFKGEEVSPGAYDVDHSAALVLINPEGQYAGVISAPHQHDEISADLIALANYQGGKTSGQQVDNTKATDAQTTSGAAVDNDSKEPTLLFEEAWIRPAPPNAPSMAAYFNLTNTSDSRIEVTDAQSPAFSMVMIHSTVMQDDVASMQHLDSVTLEPGETLAFAPMGLHVMLMAPKKPLAEGDSAKLTLIDAQGKKHTTEIFVRTPAAR